MALHAHAFGERVGQTSAPAQLGSLPSTSHCAAGMLSLTYTEFSPIYTIVSPQLLPRIYSAILTQTPQPTFGIDALVRYCHILHESKRGMRTRVHQVPHNPILHPHNPTLTNGLVKYYSGFGLVLYILDIDNPLSRVVRP